LVSSGMAKHSVEKLAKKVSKKGEGVVELLKASIEELPAEVVSKLNNAPKFDDKFLEQEAKRFGASTQQVKDIASTVATDGPVFVEQRTWEVDSDVKEHFRQLYEKEILKRRVCREQIQEEVEEYRKDKLGSPIGKPQKISVWRRCGAVYESFQQALVHQSLHFMFDSKDPRTQRATWNDILELNFPRREKGIRAALSTADRRRMMDPLLRDRLLRE